MRIALTHPYCWPYVRRGNERNIEELARYLTRKGYEVITVSTKPGAAAVEQTDFGKRILHRGLAGPFLRRIRVEETHTFFFSSFATLASLGADVVHSWYFSDGLAASYASRWTHHRSVLQINGVPVPGYSCHRVFPPEAWAFRAAAQRADAAIVCSEFIRRLAVERYGIKPLVIPPPVTTDRYTPSGLPADGPPVILSVADFNVRRKGVRVLVRAFAELKSEVPNAILRLAGKISLERKAEALEQIPHEVHSDIEFLGELDSCRIAQEYRDAFVMALPSMWEPSGTVVLEALSVGTPVVVTNHGGLPEFVNDTVGVLFEPKTEGEETFNSEGLAEALLRGLKLSRTLGIGQRCRAHAERFSWTALGPKIERVYAVGGLE